MGKNSHFPINEEIKYLVAQQIIICQKTHWLASGNWHRILWTGETKYWVSGHQTVCQMILVVANHHDLGLFSYICAKYFIFFIIINHRLQVRALLRPSGYSQPLCY